MKQCFCLILAVLLCAACLAGCQKEVAPSSAPMAEGGGSLAQEPEGNSQAVPEPPEESGPEEPEPVPENPDPLPARELESLPPLPPASAAPQLPESAPRLVMSRQEYHPDQDGIGCGCIVEIPRLEGDGEDISRVNAPMEELAAEWEEFLAAPIGAGHSEYGPSMEIRTLPYSNSRWVQAVVHYIYYPNYAYRGDTLSVNYDLEQNRAVTVEEMLERLSLSPEFLAIKLQEQELSQVLFYFSYPSPQLQEVKVQAFRGREDGSVVFYLWVSVLPGKELEEDRKIVTYDTRDGSFSEFRANVPSTFLETPSLLDTTLQWQND